MKIKKKKIKILFAGTPKFSSKHLKKLCKKKYKIIAVLTKPDTKKNRKMKIKISPVKKIAKKNKIKIYQPKNLNKKKTINKIKSFKANLMIVIAYGFIIPKKILKLFPLGCINIHPSLLPRWQGACPIQWALLKGDKKTGITIIKMNKYIDQGNIICSFNYKIKKKDTNITLNKKLNQIGIKALIYILKKIKKSKKIKTKKQKTKKIFYAKKIKKKHGKINWKKKKSKTIERMIKAFNPWPSVYFNIKKKTIKIWKAKTLQDKKKNKNKPGTILSITKNGIKIQTKKKILKIKKLQISGSKKINAKEFYNANHKWIKKKDIL
ncbi:methionyl-tRNA formyltransferase [Buchnera aphidicola]|uniref:methionyl-tRNA formyltransferase n=1 Tax=Buchnera aphidicola TaxID=9 RepID=UPI0031B7FB80